MTLPTPPDQNADVTRAIRRAGILAQTTSPPAHPAVMGDPFPRPPTTW